jgi:hypothetical protein
VSSVSAILGAEAAPRTFDHAGKRYTLRAWDQQLKTAWERWLEGCAWESLVGLSPAAQKIAADTVGRNVSAQEYRYYGDTSHRAMQTPSGAMYLVVLIFGCTDEEAWTLASQRAQEVGTLVKVTLEEAAARDGLRPNLTAPVPTPAPAQANLQEANPQAVGASPPSSSGLPNS